MVIFGEGYIFEFIIDQSYNLLLIFAFLCTFGPETEVIKGPVAYFGVVEP